MGQTELQTDSRSRQHRFFRRTVGTLLILTTITFAFYMSLMYGLELSDVSTVACVIATITCIGYVVFRLAKYRWFWVSLWMLLLCVLLLVLLASIGVAVGMQRAKKQREAVAAIRASGGCVRDDWSGERNTTTLGLPNQHGCWPYSAMTSSQASITSR